MPKALNDLECLSKSTAERIFDKMDWFFRQDDPLHFARPVKGRPAGASHRFRVGAYRVLVTVKQRCISVLAVQHRREAYRL